jgi:WD40 repeat protein
MRLALHRARVFALAALASACSNAAPEPRAASARTAVGAAPLGAPAAPVFARGVVSSDDAIAPAFARDGRAVYFVKTGRSRKHTRLMVSRLDGGEWATPEPAPFGDAAATESSPFVAADGSVYFTSDRPRAAGDGRTDLDLWVARPTAGGFAPPQHLGAPIESPALETGPSLTRDGTLYFTSSRAEPPGIYRAARLREGYAEPERLPETINRPDGYTSTPFVAPDESFLLFYFQPVGPAGVGQADLYVSWRRGGGWSEPKALGPEVNTPAYGEFSPTLSPDGRTLFFARNEVRSYEPKLDIAWENIFHVPVARIEALRAPGRDGAP